MRNPSFSCGQFVSHLEPQAPVSVMINLYLFVRHFRVTYLILVCYKTHGLIQRTFRSIHKIKCYAGYGIFKLRMAAILKKAAILYL